MKVDSANMIQHSDKTHTKIIIPDKVKQCFWNIFSSGLPSGYDIEALRKIFLLNLMFFLGSFFLILLGTIEFFLRDFILGIVNLSFFLLLMWFFFYLRKTKNHNFVSLTGTTIAGFFFFFLIAYGGIGNTAYVWTFTYPLVSIFLLGTRRGTVFSLLLLIMACTVFVFGGKFKFFATYNFYLKLRFIPAYITIFLLTFVMEKTRELFRRRLESAKFEIEKTVGKLEQANKSLRESEEKYRTFFNTSKDCVYISSIDGRVLDMNDAAVDFFGYDSKEELWKIKIPDLYDKPEDREKYINVLRKQSYAREFPINMRKKDGSILHALVTTVPKKDDDGNIIAFQGTIRDITDQIKAEKEIRILSKAVEQSPALVMITDPDGKIEYVNKAFTQITGYAFDEVKGKNPRILQSGETPTSVYKDLWNTITSGKSWEGSLKNKTKDGVDFWEKDIIGPILDADGKTSHYLALKEDITEKKAMEEQLRQAHKMEALGTLAGGVAHDLNNVLSGIVGYPDLLLLKLPENSPLRKPLLSIKETGHKAAAIVQDLLTLARVGVAAYEVLNLNTVISEYLESPEYEMMKSFYPDVEVETRLDAGLLNIFGSPIHILKVVMNLVSNSAEAIGIDGKISISTKNRYIGSPVCDYENIDEGNYVALTVSDSGAGISPEDIERIFEPFYTKKRMGKSGTGLGMAVVWGTVKDHKGYIDVQSTEGIGSSFTLNFPVTRQQPAGVQVGLPVEDYMGKGQSVLVVDDVKAQRELASEMLKTLGYCVVAISSGEEAVEYLQNQPADLLILDMIMAPGIDGLETYKRVLKIHPGQKAIIASGYSETDNVRAAQKLGAKQYLKKPYTLENIGLAVKLELKK